MVSRCQISDNQEFLSVTSKSTNNKTHFLSSVENKRRYDEKCLFFVPEIKMILEKQQSLPLKWKNRWNLGG